VVRPAHHGPEVEVLVRDLSIAYGKKTVLSAVNLEIEKNEIFGIIGPANSGKTSFLRVLNRMDEFTRGMHFSGDVDIGGKNVRSWRNLYALRRRIGVVFPLPVGLPLSVYDNVALAPRLAGIRDKQKLDEIYAAYAEPDAD
jgi:phosphate transport system ATP-binding protein